MPKQYGTPGPRFIYPDACTSRSLAACDPLAQLLFDRLIVQCDDQGRLEGDAAVIRALCLPLIARATVKAVDKWLAELEREGMIQRYTASGRPLLQVTNWWDYQGGMRRSYPSRWPAPRGWEGDRVRGVDAPPVAPERPPQGASASLARAEAEPSRAKPSREPAEPTNGALPAPEDSATIACRMLMDGGKWLSNREYVQEWEALDKRFGDWVIPEIQPAYAELFTSAGKVKPWDLKREVERRLAERARADELAAEQARAERANREIEERERRIRDATPEEKERADYQRRAIALGLRLGLQVPTDPTEVRAFVEEHSPRRAA